MDFFTEQDRARAKTKWLVLYFAIAVVAIVFILNVAIYLLFHIQTGINRESLQIWLEKPYWWQIGVLTVWVVIVVSGTRIFFLRGGGEKIAEMVAATPIDPDSRDPQQRMLINVVEEMSIASGVPVPKLYVMEQEDGINAFVAGFKPTETVMVVTRGALNELSRDELQGVTGHEFSHILNGDMRLNIYLIGILAGILAFGQLGMFLLRSWWHVQVGSRNRRSAGGSAYQIGLGLVLVVVGYIGVFFGRLIKAAVSRQREFLADAAAVQFTRNPEGLIGALDKIRRQTSLLDNMRAEEMSHMCFGESLNLHKNNWFATHPSLEERIRVLRGIPRDQLGPRLSSSSTGGAALFGADDEMAIGGVAGIGGNSAVATSAISSGQVNAMPASVGNPAGEHLAYANALHKQLPLEVVDNVHKPEGARQVIYALLLGGGKTDLQLQLKLIKHHENSEAAKTVLEYRKRLQKMGAWVRLPLIDMALPALKKLEQEEKEKFLGLMDKLIKADGKVSLFEYVADTVINRHLSPRAGRDQKVRFKQFKPVMEDISLLLSLLARTGKESPQVAEDIYYRVMRGFSDHPSAPMQLRACSPQKLSEALQRLNALSPFLKRSVLNACADCVVGDGVIRPVEVEVLRAVADSLDCPMPPLVA